MELVLFHWGVWQQKYLLQPTPLFCDSQVRNLYELKINEILQSAAKKVFLLVDMRYTHHLPTVHSVDSCCLLPTPVGFAMVRSCGVC